MKSSDFLPSWNDGIAKRAILEFVARVTVKNGPDYVPEPDRIAVFDNDGTLWPEQPFAFQGIFAFDRIKALLHQHPEWRNTQPFKAVIEDDHEALAALNERELLELAMTSHAGNTTEEFQVIVQDWLLHAVHPRFKRLYPEIVYRPMVELLACLRMHGFKNFIVSGGGVEFMRQWVEEAYGIRPEQVIGSSIVTKFEVRNGRPTLKRLPELDFLNDGAGKPVAINKFIGRRPIAAFGNSDGDLPMLQWTASGKGASMCMLVHHTDPDREWAYEASTLGKLYAALKEANVCEWTLVDMKKDWNRVFEFEVQKNSAKSTTKSDGTLAAA